nr:amidohydrolase [Gammaproteobacteria bacterium]
MVTDTSTEEWLARVQEDILEPDLPIIDPHHHLWIRDDGPYLFPEFLTDVYSGHNIESTVFAECHSMYRAQGPEAYRRVGEVEFVAGVSAMSDSGDFGATRVCRVLFGGSDLTLGHEIEPVLEAQIAASGGRFRGVRYSTGWDRSEKIRNVAPNESMLREPRVREALSVLARMSLSF